MSCEIRIQNWCPNGHYWERSALAADNGLDNDKKVCPHCKAAPVITNLYDRENWEAERYIEPVMISQPPIYQIPNIKRR